MALRNRGLAVDLAADLGDAVPANEPAELTLCRACDALRPPDHDCPYAPFGPLSPRERAAVAAIGVLCLGFLLLVLAALGYGIAYLA